MLKILVAVLAIFAIVGESAWMLPKAQAQYNSSSRSRSRSSYPPVSRQRVIVERSAPVIRERIIVERAAPVQKEIIIEQAPPVVREKVIIKEVPVITREKVIEREVPVREKVIERQSFSDHCPSAEFEIRQAAPVRSKSTERTKIRSRSRSGW